VGSFLAKLHRRGLFGVKRYVLVSFSGFSGHLVVLCVYLVRFGWHLAVVLVV